MKLITILFAAMLVGCVGHVRIDGPDRMEAHVDLCWMLDDETDETEDPISVAVEPQ